MKLELKSRIEDYTQEELAYLHEEDEGIFEKALNRLAAEEGLQIPGPEPEKPERKFPEPTELVYECNGHLFTDFEEARKYADFLTNLQSRVEAESSWLHSSGTSVQAIRSLTQYDKTFAITQKRLYTREAFKDIQEAARKYDQEYKDWKKRHEEWNLRTENLSALREKLSRAAFDAAYKEMQKQTCRETWEQYLEIADGDPETAWKFFVKSGTPIPEGFDPREGVQQ